MLQPLVVGLGRSGRELHLKTLARTAGSPDGPLCAGPPVACDPRPGARRGLPGVRVASSIAEARELVCPASTVVHVCTPPTARAAVLGELAAHGFDKLLVEKPLAAGRADLEEILRLRRRHGLDVRVVAHWLEAGLTGRLRRLVRQRTLGRLTAVTAVQHKPRFTRSLATAGHPTAFDVEIPHALGVVLDLAGPAELVDARWSDLRCDGRVLPRLGGASLTLRHHSGVCSELVSDLALPVRQRSITLRFDHGSATGHYPLDAGDDHAQLVVTGDRDDHQVFRDDALTAFLRRAYRDFADGPRADLAGHCAVVRLLCAAKERCGAEAGAGAGSGDGGGDDGGAGEGGTGGGGRAGDGGRGQDGGGAGGGGRAGDGGRAEGRHRGSAGPPRTRRPVPVASQPVPVAPGSAPSFPAHRLAGIGDEAAAGLDGQIAALARLGWPGIELRTVDGVPVAELGPRRSREVADRLRAAGLRTVALASRIGNWARPVTAPFADDLAELDALTDQCALLGCRYVRIMSYPGDGLPEAEWAGRVLDRVACLTARAERAGLTLLHENCAGWAGADPARMLRLVREAGSPALRLLFDTGNGLAYGYDAHEVLRRVLPYVAHVHVKDGVRTADGVTYTLPGDGRAGVADCLRTLLDGGYEGAFSLEPHLAARPHEGLRAAGGAAEPFVRAGQRLRALLDGAARTGGAAEERRTGDGTGGRG
ncbi:TIM barrel protein [Streptomyces minutiscleroticus]|uniref:TIM barrel protein n=1 Tax=Streptomyces minutiscleroticus TaxID=68238 RepID=UPI0033299007